MYDKVKIKIWVNALRSGDYKQGHEALCYEDQDGNTNYCCLGVYMKVVEGLEDKEMFEVKGSAVGPLPVYSDLRVKLGTNLVDRLCLMNDSYLERFNFNGIADYIEKELL